MRFRRRTLPDASADSVVPPTATTYGDAAGYSVPLPLSPDDATNVTFDGAPKWLSKLVSELNSLPPKLIDTTDAPAPTATSTAVIRSLKLFDAASTSTIFAFGAIACTHSTSSDISSAQPALGLGLLPLA